MTTTFNPASGAQFADPASTVELTADSPIDDVRVSYDEERVWDGAQFLAPYLGSTAVSTRNLIIRRTGGWGNRPFSVNVSEPNVSQLQPLNYAANIVAAYALNESASECNLDRSANGRNFVTAGQLASDMANLPDLIPGKGAILGVSSTNALYTGQPRYCSQYGAHWQLEGELTVTFRWWNAAPVDSAAHTPIYCNAEPTGTSSVAFQVSCTSGHQLAYYAEHLKAGQLFISTLPGLVVTPNQWLFISLRRKSDGTVRLGVGRGPNSSDQTYQDSGALLLPQSTVSGATWRCRFGHNVDASPEQPASGPMADVIVWNRFLTDDELKPQYGAAMRGLAT